MPTIHVIGAGLAGLAAALSCAKAGRRVAVYEQGPAAGGRCRSYFDRGLGVRIDNGNHLLLSGNTATMAYLEQIGARDTLIGPGRASFAFMDLANGERWRLEPGMGRLPWWVLRAARRVPGTRLRDYLALATLRRRRRGPRGAVSVASALGGTVLYRKLIEPLAVAALNTRPEVARVALLARVMAESMERGGAACVPSFPRIGLSESFVDPAIDYLGAHGGTLHLGRRVTALRLEGGKVAALETAGGPAELAAGDAVVVATPPWVAPDLVPGLTAPDAYESILNVHFRTDEAGAGSDSFIGLIGGTAEWVFRKPGMASVTVSAANRIIDGDADDLAQQVWPDVRAALALPEPMPPFRVVKERRATFAATNEQEARRPGARLGHFDNVVLAGDWTATGLPATIEGAIRSGRHAADLLLRT